MWYLLALGFGALVSPFVANHFAHVEHWSYMYLTSIGVAFLNTILLVSVFRFKTQDGEL